MRGEVPKFVVSYHMMLFSAEEDVGKLIVLVMLKLLAPLFASSHPASNCMSIGSNQSKPLGVIDDAISK